MADRKISDLTALTTPASGDFLPIVDISEAAAATKNKRITVEELMRGMPDGTAAAPGIAFENDPNTGIYSPGADQVAISTNGTESAFFSGASGRLAAGAIDFSATTFALAGGGATQAVTVTKNGVDVISLGVDGSGPRITSGGDLRFLTNSTERLRIDSSGNVGIGTSSPRSVLDVSGTSGITWISGANSTKGLLTVGTQGTSGGSLFVHTQSLNADYGSGFAVDGSYSNPGGVGTSVVNLKALGVWSPGGYGSALTFHTSLNTTSSEKVRIDSSGRVGIGTTSPGEKLDVSGVIRATNTTDSNYYSTFSNPDGLTRIRAYGGGSAICFDLGTSEKARIDSSGRLLVGTSTARSNLFNTSGLAPAFQVEGTNYSTSSISLIANGNTATVNPTPYLFLCRTRGTSVGSTTVVSSGDMLGGISYQGSDGTEFVEAGSIICEVDGTPGANDMPGRLVFSTTAGGAASPTERMRIDSLGRANFLSSDLGLELHVTANAGTATALIDGRHSASANTTGNGTRSFIVFTNGNIQNTNGSYTSISDAKLKENIVDAGSQWDDLKAIQIRNWNFKTGTGHETHRQIGPIAQELETVCPGLVFETPDCDEDGNDTGEVTKGVNQSVLYMKAVKALQEAMERIETLEARLTAAGID